MAKAAKENGRTNGVKSADSAPESEVDALKRALKDARGEVMRGQADLEASRLELQEHKRRSAQQALVAGEALREARRERDDLRGQLEALRHGAENGGGKKRKREPDDDDRVQKLEAELEEAREDLDAAHAASDEAAALRVQIAQLQAQLADAQSALEKAQRDVEAARASVPPPPAAMVAEQAGQPGFFGKLFGRRR
ncbi:MAG TPA: hypothetical protein VLW85_17335 [Myxococcales bacterium]|nr:hypothetical protein [Myxococcales bacterium]